MQVFSVGMCINLQYIIFGARMNPMLMATSLEMCFCFANIVASTSPIFASMAQPVPLIVFCSFCMLGLTIVNSLGQVGIKKVDVEKSILSVIEESF
mmetsp:Transcript_8570/g.14458  ORF Transcript_8570/g.14458 Transcript_8570/m.14458 type:complete len:96 (-) Transcript_8570:118-405(-)